MANTRNARHFDAPQLHGDHPRPVTRREFVAQGFMTGAAYATGSGILSMFADPREALAELSPDLNARLQNPCEIATNGAGKIPFICFDLAGGANILVPTFWPDRKADSWISCRPRATKRWACRAI